MGGDEMMNEWWLVHPTPVALAVRPSLPIIDAHRIDDHNGTYIGYRTVSNGLMLTYCLDGVRYVEERTTKGHTVWRKTAKELK